jgi:hypothetical protein
MRFWNIVLLRDVFHQLDRNPLDISTIARKNPEKYWTGYLIKVSLRDAFHIGLVIGPRSAVLAIGCTSGQYSRSCYWTDWNWANTENIRIGLVFAVLAQ